MNKTNSRKVTETNWENLFIGLIALLLSTASLCIFIVNAFNLEWSFPGTLVRDIPTTTTALLVFAFTLLPAVIAFQNSKSVRTEWC